MTKEYIIYADESDQKGEYYSNFFGGVLVRAEDFEYINREIAKIKDEQNLFGEIKWYKVTAQYLKKYQAIIDRFFEFVKEDRVKVRIMFTQNLFVPQGLDQYQKDNTYFMLYYQFIKHAFGLKFSNQSGKNINLRIYLDKLPDTAEKISLFKSYLLNLQTIKEFQRANIKIKADQIAEVSSHDHDILQCLDVILGSMQFRLNDKHLCKPADSKRRGKKTIAKEKLYKRINENIRDIYPHFNIGISTSKKGDLANLWHHSYRHWKFIPKTHNIDPTKSKN